MGLVDRVAAQLGQRSAARADPVTFEEFGYLLGRGRGGAAKTKSGVTVGVNRALGITSWYRGVRYLSETVASLPVHTYRDRGGDRQRRADPPWLRKPDVETPWFGLVEHWMMAFLHRGNPFAFKMRNEQGQVMGLRPLHPDRVRVGQASDGTKVFEVDGRKDIGYTTREILHIPGLSYNGVVGLDPISVHAEALGLIAGADEFAARHFGNGTNIPTYVSVPQTLTKTQADALREMIEDQHRGLVNSHRLAVFGNGAEYKTVSLSPEQTQLLESRHFGVTEVARMLGVVPHKLYDLERATYSNIEHQSIESVMDGIRPWVERLEAWINFDSDLLPAGNFIEFQIEGLLRGDTKARYESYQLGVNAGWLMPAAAARLENQPAPAELEYYLRPLNHAVLRPGMGEEIPEQAAASAPGEGGPSA